MHIAFQAAGSLNSTCYDSIINFSLYLLLTYSPHIVVIIGLVLTRKKAVVGVLSRDKGHI